MLRPTAEEILFCAGKGFVEIVDERRTGLDVGVHFEERTPYGGTAIVKVGEDIDALAVEVFGEVALDVIVGDRLERLEITFMHLGDQAVDHLSFTATHTAENENLLCEVESFEADLDTIKQGVTKQRVFTEIRFVDRLREHRKVVEVDQALAALAFLQLKELHLQRRGITIAPALRNEVRIGCDIVKVLIVAVLDHLVMVGNERFTFERTIDDEPDGNADDNEAPKVNG